MVAAEEASEGGQAARADRSDHGRLPTSKRLCSSSSIEKAVEDLIIGDADSDNDDWVGDFERRYNDMTRVAPKEKHAATKITVFLQGCRSTERAAEGYPCEGRRLPPCTTGSGVPGWDGDPGRGSRVAESSKVHEAESCFGLRRRLPRHQQR